MKSSAQLSKASGSNSKSKKNSREREKRKSQGTDTNSAQNSNEKSSPSKESTRLYAGIDADSLIIYAEQTAVEHLSEDITNMLTEDINYRLRYIVNDSLIKARLSGRNAISSTDLEQTFENLNVDKVYGAPLHPNWVPFGYQNLYYLDDGSVNLVAIAEAENTYYQYLEPVVTAKWLPDLGDISKALKNYYTTMCQMVTHADIDVRKKALRNIAENSRIGQVTEWFYNFGYILLSKDITYDCLTLRALDLIRTLENSQICRINVSEKQLKLLIRLILQRLLKSGLSVDVLRPICDVLAILCQRQPLKDYVFVKISQKIEEIFDNSAVAIITAANSLGTDGINNLILPYLHVFLKKIQVSFELPLICSILETYCIISRSSTIDSTIYDIFYECFGGGLTPFALSMPCEGQPVKKDLNFAHVKHELIKTRRKICPKLKIAIAPAIDEVFEMPPENSKLRKKMENYKWDNVSEYTSDTDVVIGRTSLLLSIFKRKKKLKIDAKCSDHTLLFYNL